MSANPANAFPGPIPQRGNNHSDGLAEQFVPQLDEFLEPEAVHSSRLFTEVRALLLAKLAARVESNEEDLFESGVFDSIALVQFIAATEEHFGIHLPLDEIDTQDFATISTIAEMLQVQLRRATAPE